MKAVDTNVLVRWITRDDPDQSPVADRVMAKPTFVSLTVLLELAWTLGGEPFRFGRQAIAIALRVILTTRTITVPQENAVAWAIDRFSTGADIADMLHIVASRGSDGFVTFEKRLNSLAGVDSPLRIERPM